MSIEVRQRQTQEMMLVRPPHLTFGEFFAVCRTRWGIRDLRDQVGRRGFRNAVYQHAQQRDLEEDVEADAEAEEEAFAVAEPEKLLRGREADAREVGFELGNGVRMRGAMSGGVVLTSSLIRLLEEK